jgi:mRNA interferase MazF
MTRTSRGHEPSGVRYGVIVQSDLLLPLSTVLVAPTSTSARSASFRPGIEIDGHTTRVLVEQTGAIDVSRLGDQHGHLVPEEQWGVDCALETVLDLR